MIPIKLTINGLFSYQKETVIDFNPLIDSQVFGIFGGVGSGKSALLDAITFALYDKLDRLGSRDGRGYNMMNLQSKELFIDFEFKTGPHDDKYRFTVKTKRNSKNFLDVKSFSRKSYKWVDNSWLPLEVNTAESILGVSYQNFKRTVIIPQGKFQEFLQLGATDRSIMLKEIFNLGKYDLSFKTNQIQKINDNNIATLEGENLRYASIDEKLINEKRIQLKEIESQHNSLHKLTEKLDIEIQNLKEVQQLFEEKIELTKKLNTLESKKEFFNELEFNINLLSTCLIHFKPLLDRKIEVSNEKILSDKNLKSIKISLEQSEKDLVEKQALLDKNRLIVDKKLEIYNEIDEISKIIEIKKLAKNIVEIDSRMTKGKNMLNSSQKKLDIANTTEKSLKKSLKTLKKEKPDYKILTMIDAWYKQYDVLKQNSKEHKISLESEEKSLNYLEQEFYNSPILRKAIIDISKIAKDDILPSIQKHISDKNKEITQAKEELIQLKTHLKIEGLSHKLKDGTACPLCGSLEHPQKLVEGDTDKQILKLESYIAQINKDIEHLQNLKYSYEQYEFKSKEKKKSIDSIKNKIEKSILENDKHLKLFIWKEYKYNDKSNFEKSYLQANLLEKSIEKEEKELENIETIIDKLEKDTKQFTSILEDIKREQITDISTKETLEEQIRILELKKYIDKSPTNLQQIQFEKTRTIKDAEKLNDLLDKDTDNLNTKIGHLKGRYLEEKKQFDSIEKELAQLLAKLTKKHKETNINDIEQVQSILDKSKELESRKSELKDFKTALQNTEFQLSKINKKTEGLEFDKEKYEKKKSTLLNLKLEKDTLQESIGSTKKEIEAIESDLKEKKRIEKELKALNIRRENIKVLTSLFKGKGFVDYISSVYLEQLCNVANSRFYKLTKHQLELELTDKNDFKVIDYLNDAKERSVKTLSGGQTFQASLSLALALAESVQHQSKSKQNFFFLDEGFGTQDKESLQVVFDTIKSLRRENRIVGIISHMEELKSEIDVYLDIHNDIDEGSLISTSY